VIKQFQLPTIEPEADVWIRDIKKGANPLKNRPLIFTEGCLEYLETNKWGKIHA